MRRLLCSFVLLMLFAVCCIGSASAAPSYAGYTGLLFVPSAETLQEGELQLAAQSIDFDLGNFNGFSISYGITDIWELGIANATDGPGVMDGASLNSKYSILQANDLFNLAAGIIIPLEDSSTGLYGVISHELRGTENQVVIHAGYGTGGIVDGFFAGVDAVLSPNLNAMLEYDSNNLNAGARYHFTERFSATAGLFNLSNLGLQLAYLHSF